MKDAQVLGLEELDRTQTALAGGKGANLGELMRIEGLKVPPGVCVTTEAFDRVVAPAIANRLEQLAGAKDDELPSLGAALRNQIERIELPPDLAAELTRRIDPRVTYAVRSSATAEDLPGASFAGQQDSFLGVRAEELLTHVSRCWASLFTDRAIVYRRRNGFDHRQVKMAVVVQQLVDADAAGVLFTADPVSANRTVTSIEATAGLGEALVAGKVNPDVFKVRDGAILSGGPSALLTGAQAIALAQLGRRIEAHFGQPQDLEWCRSGGDFHFVQARPITTLFPIPVASDAQPRVYLSVGHQQMMTDAIKPLGLSLFQRTALRPMFEAGARLFVDVTAAVASPRGRAGLLELMGKSDPLSRDALQTVLERPDFIRSVPDTAPAGGPPPSPPPLPTDPAIVAGLIARSEASLATLSREIQSRSGPALLDFILADLDELKRSIDPQRNLAIMAGMEATWWLNERLQEWLGEKNAADALAQSAPGNVTSEMGLALLDLADALRPFPEAVALLKSAKDDDFIDELPAQARAAFVAFLEQYGMRCVGEIDLTRPRWSEQPSALLPVILGNLEHFAPGEAARRFERGLLEAAKKEQEILARLRELPDGAQKADETKRMIDRLRTFIGYREYPKYSIVSRYFVYKQALLREAATVLGEVEDLFFLTLPEFREVVRTKHLDVERIRERKAAFRAAQALMPPRVLTSDGEALTGTYRRGEVPAGALVGLPVSAGTVVGRARVVSELANATLEPGDILVTAYTDPSWTPLFLAIKGLVTEVGGVMTHGSVIAREYGLPAVVGVPGATRLIRDGQRIRVHGTEGYVEVLEPAAVG